MKRSLKLLLAFAGTCVFGVICCKSGYFIGETNANIRQGGSAYVCLLDLKKRLEKNDPNLLGDLDNLLKRMDPKNGRGINGQVMIEYYLKRESRSNFE